MTRAATQAPSRLDHRQGINAGGGATGVENDRRPGSLTGRLALTFLVLSIFGSGFAGTVAFFTDTSSNEGNAFATGTVNLTDNDSGAAMLSLADARPGNSDTSCISVSYTGSVPSTVRLYGATSGTGLDAHLNVSVTRGTLPTGAFDDCTGFSPDAADYIGAGSGVIYSGTLQAFADNSATGLLDPASGAPETWTNGETHGYMIVVTVGDSDAAQGKTSSQTFIWEAANS
jgi:hypothetical protein